MSRFPLALFVLAIGLATNLHAMVATDLIGTWTIDAEATWTSILAAPQMKQMTEDQLTAAKPMFIAQMTAVKVDISADKMSLTQGAQTQEQTYKVLSSEGGTLTLEVTEPTGKVKTNTASMKDGKLNIVDNGMAMVMIKAESKEEKKDAK
jgi:hypothetical protein